MPTKKRKTKKKSVRAKKKRPARKAKKKVMKKKKKAGKKASARKRATRKAVKAVKAKLLGKVVHYYDRIGVAIVEVKSPIQVGDAIILKKGEEEVMQNVGSMQIDHLAVSKAKKGDVIGMKVNREVREGTIVTAPK